MSVWAKEVSFIPYMKLIKDDISTTISLNKVLHIEQEQVWFR